jgi:iron complex outermembrane receptor protein
MLMLLATGSGLQAADEETLVIDNVVVTANKMEEDLTDVPQSITVVDKYTIEEKGIKDIPDVIEEIPNMFNSPNHGNSVNFRGLNASMFTRNNPVVVYIDGVPISDKYGFDASLANVERVEVLRGPQGTLYGKDAIGAVINVVTMQPTDTWQGKVGAEYGRFNYVEGLLNLSGPVVNDKLYFGVNGRYRQDDGWIENDCPGKNDDANRQDDRRISAYLLFKPTDRLSARFTASNEYTRTYWMDGYGLAPGSGISDFSRDDADHVAFDVATYEKTEVNSQSLQVAYAFDPVTVTSTTTHRRVDMDALYDADFGDNPLYDGLAQMGDSTTKTWTQEVRVASNNTEGFRWVGGGYFDTEKRELGPYGMQFPYYDNSGTYYGNFVMDARSHSDSDTWAVFGQAMVPLGAGFELTLGGRYQRIKKEVELNMYYLPIGVSGAPYYQLEADKTWDTFLPKAALSYKITDAWTVYFSWSKGYMPGGFNDFATSGTASDNSFKPQKSTNYELGIKGSFDRLRLAASIFRMDIEDIHVYKSVGTGIYLTDNADEAHSQGVEVEVTYLPFRCLELTLAAGIIDAEYDDYDAGDARFDGEKIEQTPAHTLKLGVAYNHPRGFYARADVKNQGRTYYYDDVNKAFDKEGSFTVVDVRAGYRFKGWDVYAYADNLTDEEYVNSYKSSSLVAIATFGNPRVIGVGARYQF